MPQTTPNTSKTASFSRLSSDSILRSSIFARDAGVLDDRPGLALHRDILTETAHLLLEDSDPDTLCQAVFERLQKPFGIDFYFHFLLAADESHLQLASSGGSSEVRSHIGMRILLGELVCGRVAQDRRERCVVDVGRRQDEMTAFIRSIGVRTYACFPLIARDRLLGTLSFGSTRRLSFAEEELELFRLVAAQVTLATDRRVRIEHLRELETLAATARMNATLAHEINNPLESLGSLLYMLHDEVHTPEAIDMVQRAESQVERLGEVARRTLDGFRGKNQNPHAVDLSRLLEDLACDIQLPHHTRLEHQIDPGLCVDAIPGELRQVFFNLLLNAGNYTPPGKPVTLLLRRDGNTAEVRIRDEGEGVSAESGKHLFEPFYTTRHSNGTGVGLWLSKEIVERAGGSLSFESNTAGRSGTDFIVRLPLRPEPTGQSA